MGTGYTRNDTTNNIADGNVINAADLDGEFDAIVTALSTSGHTHDGTAAEGGPVTKIGPAQDIVISASIVSPKTDNALDLGTSTLEFKDLFLDGTAHIDTLDVDENANIDGNLVVGGNLSVAGTTAFNGGTITLGDAAGDSVVFGADINSSIIPNTDSTFDLGSTTQEWRDLFLDGTAHIDTLDVDVNATVAGTLGVTGIATFTDDIIIGDGKTIGSASDVDAITIAANGQLTLTQTLIGTALDISGDIDVDGTTNLDVVDIDGAVDMASTLTVGGVVDITDATDASDATGDTGALRTEGGASIAKKLFVGTDLDVDGTSNLDIVDIDGAVDMATTLQVDGVATFTARDIHSGGITIANAGQIGSVGDPDAIAIASDGVVTLTQKLVGTELDISGNIDVDGTTNLDVVDIDGAVDMATTALVTGVLTTTATQVATGGITSGSNIVSDTDSTDDLGTTSVRWANLFVDGITATDQITATGFTGTLDGILGSGAAAAATVTSLNTSGVVNLNLTTDSTSSTSGALIVDGGVGVAKKLFVGTDLDVNGTTNLDAVDIDGAVDMALTALVTGVLTTTAATVFNGGFASNADSTMGTNKKLIFRDSDIHISSVNDGDLMIVADDEIDITSTLIDINGAVEISGATTQTGISTSAAKDVFNAGLSIKNAASSAGFIEFFEDSDNGSNKVTLVGPASTADITLILPAEAGNLTTEGTATALAIALG